MKKKVFMVEDHKPMSLIIKILMRKNYPSVTEFGVSETAEEALERIPSFNPDLLLVDISLPGIDGIEMIRRLGSICNEMKILVVTGHEVDLYRNAALEAGADDIVSKSDSEKMLHSIGKYLELSENQHQRE
ncbi:MAG: response regulator [Chitinivibrionales bacterium]